MQFVEIRGERKNRGFVNFETDAGSTIYAFMLKLEHDSFIL